MKMMAGNLKGGQELGLDLDSLFTSIKIQSLVAMSRGKMSMESLRQLLNAMNQ